jgi:hypothetical protein
MPRATHRGRARLQSYVEPAFADRVSRYCLKMGVSESAIVRVSLDQYLSGTGDAKQVIRRLDRLGGIAKRIHRDLEILSHAFSVFVRVWFAHTPSVPDGAKPGARAEAESRYKQFVEYVAEEFNGGRRFVDDLPGETVASEAELEAIAGSAESPDAKGGS